MKNRRRVSNKANSGFTLIEMVIVMTITILLSGMLIGFSRQSNRQLQLLNTEAKILSLITRAKFLSIETFFGTGSGGDRKICAYGIKIDRGSGEIFIFQDEQDKLIACPANNVYDAGDSRLRGELNELKLDPSIASFSEETNLSEVVFIPPEPKVILNNDPARESAALFVKGSGASGRFVITINNAGQIREE